jgi:arylsulfatase A-like enzyme
MTRAQGGHGRTIDECAPGEPSSRPPRPRRPNVIIWLVDDVGFGHLSPYGGPIEMPALQRLVDRGVRFTNAHVTPLCAPTRACLLTGRNHHTNHMGSLPRWTVGVGDQDARIPRANGFLSEMLLEQGYATYCVGKWHLTTTEEHKVSASRTAWPLGRGFERFYGFMGGQTSSYNPHIVLDNGPVYPPKGLQQDYHLSEDLIDTTIRWLHELRADSLDKPFFVFLPFQAGHAPHHAPKQWIDRYRGRFDAGWDALRDEVHLRQQQMGIVLPGSALSVRDPDVPAWDAASPEQRLVYARLMEAFAGMCAHMDHHVGRLLDELEAMGELDDTIILALSDNGASSEGGPAGAMNNQQWQGLIEQIPASAADLERIGSRDAYNHFPWGWAWAGNTPFRRWKRENYRGGCAVPFVVSWPAGLGSVTGNRDGFVYVTDVVPTMLDLLKLEAPTSIGGVPQAPIEGVSFAPHLRDATAASAHRIQYFETMGHRALVMDGWRAVCPWPGTSWTEGGNWPKELLSFDLDRLEQSGWELYDIDADPAETNNLANQEPHRLRMMVSMWWHEAGRYGVLPILGGPSRKPARPAPPARHVFHAGMAPVFIEAAPNIINTNYEIRAELVIPEGGASGMVLAHGGRFGGYGLLLDAGRPRFIYSYHGIHQTSIDGDKVLPAGRRQLRFVFEKTGAADLGAGHGAAGVGTLYVDGKQVGRGRIEPTAPAMINFSGMMTCGYHPAEEFEPHHGAPFAFSGHIVSVEVRTDGAQPISDEAWARGYLQHQ